MKVGVVKLIKWGEVKQFGVFNICKWVYLICKVGVAY